MGSWLVFINLFAGILFELDVEKASIQDGVSRHGSHISKSQERLLQYHIARGNMPAGWIGIQREFLKRLLQYNSQVLSCFSHLQANI